MELELRKLKHLTAEKVEPEEALKTFGVEPFSCLIWLIVNGKSLKNMVRDIEFYGVEQRLHEITSRFPNNEEALFNLAKIKCHEENYSKAINFLNKALVQSFHNEKLRLWKAVMSIKLSATFPSVIEPGSMCCGKRNESPKAEFLKRLVSKFYYLDETIESMWGLMEISLMSSLVKGEDIEPSRYYAAKIKKMNYYYGYLAWGYLYLKENKQAGVDLILALISHYPNKPEAYYLAWRFYFKSKKYELAKDIAAKAFIKITDSEYTHYYIIFCLNLAKSYYFTGNFINCIELLHRKFIEHPDYPVFLYAFAKYCVMSEDFNYSGIAKGTFRELIRLCDPSRIARIYYWLCRSYLFTRQFSKAYKYSLKAITNLGSNEKSKILEMQKNFYELKPHIEKILRVQGNIKDQNVDQFTEGKCEEIKDFHKPTGEMIHAEILYFKDNKEEAINTLKAMISTSRMETSAYFKLLNYDPDNKEDTFRRLLARAKCSQIPVQIWVKANLQYARFLFRSSQYRKAFYILRLLAKLIPPIPSLNIPYCRALQNVANFQELCNPITKVEEKELINPAPLPEVFNIREASFRAIEEAQLTLFNNSTPRMGKIPEKQALKKFNSVTLDYTMDEENQDVIQSQYLNGHPIFGLSFSSKPKFLYYIAKFSAKIFRNKEEGLLAIKDYKEILKLEKNRCRVEIQTLKAGVVEENLYKI